MDFIVFHFQQALVLTPGQTECLHGGPGLNQKRGLGRSMVLAHGEAVHRARAALAAQRARG